MIAPGPIIMPLNRRRASAPTGGGGGDAYWVDAIEAESADSDDTTQDGVQHATRITITEAGTVSKLRLYFLSAGGGGGLKLGLFNSSKALLAIGTATVAGAGWIEATITPQAVAAGTYYVGFAGNFFSNIRYLNGAGETVYKFASYAAAFANPFGPDGSFSRAYAAGAYLET